MTYIESKHVHSYSTNTPYEKDYSEFYPPNLPKDPQPDSDIPLNSISKPINPSRPSLNDPLITNQTILSNQLSNHHQRTVSSPLKESKKDVPRKRNVKDFTFGKTLGEGSYSTVMSAIENSTGKEFAVKILDKRHIIKEKKTKYVNIEKNTLNKLNHPFIIRLHYTFQDPTSLYFVLDIARNGELLNIIRKNGLVDEISARFYIAEILLAVEYIHSENIIHRDIKPENILLDDDMHIKLTDFGTAKILKDEIKEETEEQGARANSFVGTAEYVSPELLTDKSAEKSSDIWAIGCILYQLLTGRPPFKGNNEYQTFQKIIHLDYSIPDSIPSVCQDLISRILTLDPDERLSIPEIKEHAFFEGFDWVDLHKKIPPSVLSSGYTTESSLESTSSSLKEHLSKIPFANSFSHSSSLLRDNESLEKIHSLIPSQPLDSHKFTDLACPPPTHPAMHNLNHYPPQNAIRLSHNRISQTYQVDPDDFYHYYPQDHYDHSPYQQKDLYPYGSPGHHSKHSFFWHRLKMNLSNTFTSVRDFILCNR